MLGIKTLTDTVKEVASSKLDYFFMLYNLVFFSRIVGITTTDSYLVVNLGIVLAFAFIRKRLIINKYLFLIILGFILISIAPVILFNFSLPLYIGYVIRLCTAYLIIMYFGVNFLKVFTNSVYVLAYISIPLFILQITSRFIYVPLEGFTDKVIFDGYKGLKAVYFFIFYVNPGAKFRNSGFMSEPSAFGALMAWTLLMLMHKNKFKFDSKIGALFVAGITTFSIGMYVYLCLLLMLQMYFMFTKQYLYNIFKGLLVLALVLPFVWNTDIVQDNINSMTNKIEGEDRNYELVSSNQAGEDEVSRVSGAKINIQYFLEWPFGYGLTSVTDKYTYLGTSPNGLSNMIVKFGIGILLVFILSANNLFKILRLYSGSSSLWVRLLTMLIFILPLSGWSFFNQPMMFAIFLWPIVMIKSYRRIFYFETEQRCLQGKL